MKILRRERYAGGKPASTQRPFWLKALAAGYLLSAVYGGFRLQGVIASWMPLGEYFSTQLLIYIAASGLFCLLAGLASAIVLWLGTRYASLITRSCAGALFAWYWFDRIWMTRAPDSQANLPFALFASILLLLFALLAPALPDVKRHLEGGRSGTRP